MKKKAKKTAAKAKPAKKSSKAKPNKQPEETMDRKALKSVAAQLKEMGADLKVLKKDDDATLQRKVNAALHKMPSPELLTKLESIEPGKLVSVLKRDCLGIFIDLADPSCVRCTDSVQCATEYLKNLKGGLVQLKTAMPDAKKPEVANDEEEETEVELGYEPKRSVFICNVKNPNKKGDDFYGTVQAILDEEPENMKQVRKIVEREFEQDDNEFLETLMSLRDEGVIKLDFDLSASDKKELRAAGYDV